MNDIVVQTPKWAIGLTPYVDESLMGFIFRLAEHRRLSTAHALYKAAGFEWQTKWPPREWLVALADEADLTVEALEPLAMSEPKPGEVLFRGFRLPAALFRKRGAADRRVCPACLAQRAYHRAMWDLACVSVCPIHNVVLIDQCSCGAPLTWEGRGVDRCPKCSQDLCKLTPQAVNADDAMATGMIYGLLGETAFAGLADIARSMPPFQDLAPEEIVDFLWRLGLEVHGTRPKIFSVEHPGEYAWEAHLALTAGLSAMRRWPDGFHEVLDRIRSRWSSRGAAAVHKWLSSLPDGHGTVLARALAEWRERHGHLFVDPAPA